jgi:hypothetical protein
MPTRSHLTTIVLLIALLLAPSLVQAQELPERPIPYPVQYPPSFQQALDNDTRSRSGAPGSDYWQNEASYDLEATLTPSTKMLRGEGTIRYQNNSPDTLSTLLLHLRQNIYKAGAPRRAAGMEVTGGIQIASVEAGGQSLPAYGSRSQMRGDAGYVVDYQLMRVRPPEPVPPGGEVTMTMTWSYKLRSEGPSPRQGTDGEVFYVAYWYPQMAVYDDVEGWDTDRFLQHAELYADYADYDVSVTAPEGWIVGATGTLQNASDVLTRPVRRRLDQARESDEIVSVVEPDQRGTGLATPDSDDGTLTWNYEAKNTRDFAFGTSDQYVWDATTAETDDDDDGTALIHALYRPDAESWDRAAEFGRYSIELLSDRVMPYPYPQMTVVEGIVGGGMEYPMITIISGDGRSPESLFGTTLHEIAHMWFPMIVGSQENEHIWMDESMATYFTRLGRVDFWDADPWTPNTGYFRKAGTIRETPLMRHGDLYPSVSALVTASYDKASRMIYALRGLYGQENVSEALQTYAERWAFKHPYPFDLFNTFEDVLGDDLDWFWTPMAYETWTLDQAVADVEASGDGVTVRVRDEGRTPMPADVRLTYASGETETKRLPVDPWLEGEREATLTFPAGEPERVEIDPEGYLPDVDRSDNVWPRETQQ